MDLLRQHEIFEIDVLEKMNSMKVLEPLVFGGGSMLRLCHDLNRYSADLHFWMIKKISQEDYFEKIRQAFDKLYEITDSQIKHYTILFELRSALNPKRLRIEIRREIKDFDFQNVIRNQCNSRHLMDGLFRSDEIRNKPCYACPLCIATVSP